MSNRSEEHETFSLTRELRAAPDIVYRAWSEPSLKKRWFVDSDGSDWETLDYKLDFRVGGTETGRFRYKGSTVHGNETAFIDIVPEQRIVFAYSMFLDGKRTSVSLATVAMRAAEFGTHLTYTEQGVFLDGLDSAEPRKAGWEWLLDALGHDTESMVSA